MQTNYDEMGIRFETEPVRRQSGSNASDRHVIGNAQIPVPVDYAKIVAAFGEEAIMGSLNGTSWRVMAQDIGRRMVAAKATPEQIQLAVINRLKGIRNTATSSVKIVEKIVKQYPLPDGTVYTGIDLTEYRQMALAAYVDLGIDPTAARMIVEKMSL